MSRLQKMAEQMEGQGGGMPGMPGMPKLPGMGGGKSAPAESPKGMDNIDVNNLDFNAAMERLRGKK